MKVSIIIPIFNVEPYIERCIKSVENQTYQNIEVFLIDDCGEDKSIQTAARYLQTLPDDSRIKYTIIHHERNRGLSAARNTGIKASSGDYIYFLDSDDEIISHCIEKLVNYATLYDVDYIMADYTRTGILVPHRSFNLKLEHLDSNEQILSSHFSHDLHVMASNRLIKREFIEKHNLYFQEGILYEDELWSFMAACKANKVFVTDDKTYLYTIRPDSITQNITLRHYSSQLKIIACMVAFVNANPELMSKKRVYDYIEELKSTYFAGVLKLKMPRKFKVNYYKSLRSDNYLKKGVFEMRNELSFPQLIRNIHYTLPHGIGYQYYQFSLKMKKWLNV